MNPLIGLYTGYSSISIQDEASALILASFFGDIFAVFSALSDQWMHLVKCDVITFFYPPSHLQFFSEEHLHSISSEY